MKLRFTSESAMFNNKKKQYKNVGLKALRKKAGLGNETLSAILIQNFLME